MWLWPFQNGGVTRQHKEAAHFIPNVLIVRPVYSQPIWIHTKQEKRWINLKLLMTN